MPIQYNNMKLTPHAIYSDKDGKLKCTKEKCIEDKDRGLPKHIVDAIKAGAYIYMDYGDSYLNKERISKVDF